MAPIYDSDLAEDRFSKAEWNHFELWERVEQRLRRHNRLWIAGTVLVFLALSSVPIFIDQRPRWTALSGVRILSQEISHVKRDAALEHTPFRIRFDDNGSVTYRVEKVEKCDDPSGSVVSTGSLVPGAAASDYRLITPGVGKNLSIPGLIQDFCYDPLVGSFPYSRGEKVVGFAVAPAKDLTAGRLDRLSVLLLSGATAEVSFE